MSEQNNRWQREKLYGDSEKLKDGSADEASGGMPDTMTAASPNPDAANAPSVAMDFKKKSKRPGRAGIPYYSSEDIDLLLSCAEQYEPLGANEWALVKALYADEAKRIGRPEKDQDSLKEKFDKLVNTKKKTGDPSCPPQVRRAKHLARNILNKCSALTIGGEAGLDSDNESSLETKGTGGNTGEAENEPSRKRRKAAAVPVGARKSKGNNANLVAHVGEMTKFIGDIAHSMSSSVDVSETNNSEVNFHTGGSGNVNKDEVVNIVRQELQETKARITEIRSLLRSTASQSGTAEKP